MAVAKKAVVVQEAQAPVVVDQAQAMITMIERVVMNPESDINKLEKMIDLQERLLDRQAESDFNQAMAQCQAEMTRVSADAVNPQTRSKYASYAQLDKALRPVYTRHGLSLSFNTGQAIQPDHILVMCYVTLNGYSRQYDVEMPSDGKGAKGGAVMTKTHATGSAMSYGMRYLLKMIFNVAIGEDDNDGNGAEAPVAFITQDQQASLQDQIDQITEKGAKANFLNWLQAKGLNEIRVSQFDMAVHALKNKIDTEAKK